MNKLYFSSHPNLYKQEPNPKMSYPSSQTKKKQNPKKKNAQKKCNEGKKVGKAY